MPLTDAQRRTRGQWRLVCWLPKEYERKVRQLCERSGFARDDLLMGLIDGELRELDAAQTKRKKGK